MYQLIWDEKITYGHLLQAFKKQKCQYICLLWSKEIGFFSIKATISQSTKVV